MGEEERPEDNWEKCLPRGEKNKCRVSAKSKAGSWIYFEGIAVITL